MANASEQGKLQDLLQTMQEALDAGDLAWVRQGLQDMHPSEIAELLESLPTRERDDFWQIIDPDLKGDVLAYLNDQARAGLLEDMHPEKVAEVTRDLDADDVADIVQDLPDDKLGKVLRSMDKQHRERLQAVLLYEENSAGGLMNPDTITVRSDVSLDVVFRYLRRYAEVPDHTDSLIVVDRDNRYLGMLPMARLVTSDPDLHVGDVMDRGPDGIPATMPAADVARLFDQRNLLSAAVVDELGRLLGQITIDDIVDVIKEQGEHSLMSLAGLDEEDDMFAPVLDSARRRTLWLGINLVTALIASWVIGRFEGTIQQIVALAVLMPVVASMGGIAGSQTLTIVIRGLALGQIGIANSWALLRKELLVGIVNSLVWALVVGLVADWWFGSAQLGIVIGAAMIINLITAAVAGVSIPLLLKKMDIDPALAGGVVLTTFTDVVGFMSFLGLATVFLL